MTNVLTSSVTHDAKAGVKFTEPEKQAHVHAYLKGKKSRRAYCELHGLTLSSFKNWISTYRRQEKRNFIPVHTAGHEMTMSPTSRIEIYKGECKIVLVDLSDLRMIVGVLQGVLLCS